MENKLKDDEWEAIRGRFISYLNTFESDPELQLDADYFYDYELHTDEKWYGMYRYLLLTLFTMDDGGPTMLYLHTSVEDITDIEFGCFTFDTTTTVWIGGTS